MEEIIVAAIAVIGAYIILKLLRRLLQNIRKRAPLSGRLKRKADIKFNTLLDVFKNKNKHNPAKNEMFGMAVNASHLTIKKKGSSGHWKRQKVRKYLLEKHNIVKDYKMR